MQCICSDWEKVWAGVINNTGFMLSSAISLSSVLERLHSQVHMLLNCLSFVVGKITGMAWSGLVSGQKPSSFPVFAGITLT